MLLTIDVGNTNTAIGIYNGDKIVNHWRTETKKESTADEFAVLLGDFFQLAGCSFEIVDGVAISNVVPSVQHALASMSERYFGVRPLCVTAENAGIKIDYPNPAEIGADRLANAVAAYEKVKGAVIVVDFGTATTFDYINPDGVYCGGAIAPGIAIANEALYRWASKLPRVDLARTERVVTKSTIEAIQAGAYHGYAGLVRSLVEKMSKEVGTNPGVLATGGLASFMVREIGVEIGVERFLTLDGLRIIYNGS